MSPQFAFHVLKIKDALQDVVGGDDLNIRTKVRTTSSIDASAKFPRSSNSSKAIISPKLAARSARLWTSRSQQKKGERSSSLTSTKNSTA